MQVYKIDNHRFFAFETYFIEEPTEFEITIPVNTDETNTFYKPKWDGEKWLEGATKEEIDRINKPVPQEPNEFQIRLGQQEQALGILATQVAKNTLLQMEE